MARKKIESMSDRDLLIELVKESRRRVLIRRIILVLLLALVGLCIYAYKTYVPQLITTLKHYKEVIDSTEVMINELQKNFNEVDWEGLKQMAENINETFGDFDWEGFRRSLDTVQETVGALTRIFGR